MDTTDEMSEGERVAAFLMGSGPRHRSSAPEPALLPHLAAYLCHDFSIEKVLQTARDLGLYGGAPPPWPALFYSTLTAACTRPELVAHLREFSGIPEMLLRVGRLPQSPAQADTAAWLEQCWDEPDAMGSDFPSYAGAAQVLCAQPSDMIATTLDDARLDPAQLDPESVRCLLVAMRQIGRAPENSWIRRALDSGAGQHQRWTRLAHVLPDLPAAERARYADELASAELDDRYPPDYRAMVVSRIAPFVSSRRAFHYRALTAEMDPVWVEQIDGLLGAGWPETLWADVMRAHPEHDMFRNVVRPHETTEMAPYEIENRYGAAQMAMNPGEPATRGGAGEETSAPPPQPVPVDPAAPATPRALQANVMLDDDMQEVSAFVANALHVVDVSIGRGASVVADVAFDETVFDETDAKWLKLPVWLHYDGQTQKDVLRVPRDAARNSKEVSFNIRAPATGRVKARLYVMRPGGGLLLQSAVLLGDVVADAATAVGHSPGLELNVDVHAGELNDPLSSPTGGVVDGSERDGQVIGDDAMVDLDVSSLHGYLSKLVVEIETAADRRKYDDKAIDEALASLAIAGQALRARFAGALGPLMDKPVIQVLSPRAGDLLPLELVYDGDPLASDSTVCPNWREAVRANDCSGCPAADGSPHVCPRRFWGVQKVIERRSAGGGQGFQVGAHPTSGRPALRPIAGAAVGASGRVEEQDVAKVRDKVASAFGVDTQQAVDWDSWRVLVNDHTPELLVAMPHDHYIANELSSALMMGEPEDADFAPPATALVSGSVRKDVVHTENALPGPIVFLLGCNTLFKEGQIVSFADEFRDNGAALTIATMGKLVVEQAPEAADVLLDVLAQRPDGIDTLGQVLLKARRELLANGMIMALLLVANGDANWQLPAQE